MTNIQLIDKLEAQTRLERAEWEQLLSTYTAEEREYAAGRARAIAQREFGRHIYFRGIIEFTSICKNDCLYCGLRRSNRNAARYRLGKDDILACCKEGYAAGFRTFVLQGGEDAYFTDERMCGIVSAIRAGYPDCAITLSLGERSRESYRLLLEAGADRYLLRHETATPGHYALLHPAELTLENRMRCLYDLRELGYQTGCGCMVGAPGQTARELAQDMLFMREFEPQMIGIGPFIPHHDTPFADRAPGSVDMTLMLLSLCRIMLPRVLLPATTALGTLDGSGRKQGVLAGANVIMPNLSPVSVRKKYLLYDNKAITGDDAAESLNTLRRHMAEIGYELISARGDWSQERNV
jgi:biotin synthase